MTDFENLLKEEPVEKKTCMVNGKRPDGSVSGIGRLRPGGNADKPRNPIPTHHPGIADFALGAYDALC